MLTRSVLTHQEVSSMIFPGPLSSCIVILGNLFRGTLFIFRIQLLSSPSFCPKLGLYLTHLLPLHLFYNLSKCILLVFSYIPSDAVIRISSLALMVQFQLPYDKLFQNKLLQIKNKWGIWVAL